MVDWQQFLIYAELLDGERLPLALAWGEEEADRKLEGYRTMFDPSELATLKKEVQEPPIDVTE